MQWQDRAVAVETLRSRMDPVEHLKKSEVALWQWKLPGQRTFIFERFVLELDLAFGDEERKGKPMAVCS